MLRSTREKLKRKIRRNKKQKTEKKIAVKEAQLAKE